MMIYFTKTIFSVLKVIIYYDFQLQNKLDYILMIK